MEAPETRSQVKYMQIIEDPLGWDGMQKLLPVLKAIADHHGVSIANVATQYILNQKSGRGYGWNEKFQTCEIQSSDPWL